VPSVARDVNTHFRITAWPGVPLLLPAGWRCPSRLDARRSAILPEPVPMRGRAESYCYEPTPVRLSGDTYLRVCELDLNDSDAILAFVREFGTLGGSLAYEALVTPQGTTPFRCYTGAISTQDETRAIVDLITNGELEQHLVFRHMSDPTSPFLTRRGDVDVSRVQVGSVMTHIPPLVETLAAFRFAARCIRDLDAAWQAIRIGRETNAEL